jgi:hypothetical protein
VPTRNGALGAELVAASWPWALLWKPLRLLLFEHPKKSVGSSPIVFDEEKNFFGGFQISDEPR